MKGSFLTEDSYLGDIRNPLTLNRYSYCSGNPLFYSDPSGHDFKSFLRPALTHDKEGIEARDAKAVTAIQEHQARVNGVMDNIYDGLGEYTLVKNNTVNGQINNGFASGFVGSFYATYDTITHPGYLIAVAYHAAANPLETAIGIGERAVFSSAYFNAKEGNYRAIGQDVGYTLGKMTLVAAARAAIKKCGELLDKDTGEGETSQSPPRGDRGKKQLILTI